MIPQDYDWLSDITPPNTIKFGLELYGTEEKSGPSNNPEIISWGEETGIPYGQDSIPWCGLYVAIVCKRCGWDVVKNPLWARNWVNFGNPTDTPSLGDILVFTRDGGGHVGFYIAEDAEYFHVLGGNQGDAVNIIRIAKNRLLAARRPIWKIRQPDSVKPYFVNAVGNISENES